MKIETGQIATIDVLIQAFVAMPKNQPVTFIVEGKRVRPTGAVYSYRGDYMHLAVQIMDDDGQPFTAEQMATMLQSALGQELEGYKGGMYLMQEWCQVYLTPEQRRCGPALLVIEQEGVQSGSTTA